MKKKIFIISTIVAIAITAFSFAANSACGKVAQSECYSGENGKRCLHASEVGAGNCDGSKVLEQMEP
ncbi:MAG: hypothetical protein AB7S54_12745 [Bacteroidales bacterium]